MSAFLGGVLAATVAELPTQVSREGETDRSPTSKRRLSGGRTGRLWPTANVEEQRLADDGAQRVRSEGLADEERRLGFRAREQLLRIGGHENHRDRELRQDLIDGVQPRAAVGQLECRPGSAPDGKQARPPPPLARCALRARRGVPGHAPAVEGQALSAARLR